MELQPVSRQTSLLRAAHDTEDLAAAPPVAPPESANFYVERPSILETAGVVALIATAAALGVWFIAFVHSKLASEENSYSALVAFHADGAADVHVQYCVRTSRAPI